MTTAFPTLFSPLRLGPHTLKNRICLSAHADSLHLCDLQACVKHLRGTKTWTRNCDTLREEVICFVRERLASSSELEHLRCYIR